MELYSTCISGKWPQGGGNDSSGIYTLVFHNKKTVNTKKKIEGIEQR